MHTPPSPILRSWAHVNLWINGAMCPRPSTRTPSVVEDGAVGEISLGCDEAMVHEALVHPVSGTMLVRSLRHNMAGGVQDRSGPGVREGLLRQLGQRPPLDGAGTTAVCAGNGLSRGISQT